MYMNVSVSEIIIYKETFFEHNYYYTPAQKKYRLQVLTIQMKFQRVDV